MLKISVALTMNSIHVVTLDLGAKPNVEKIQLMSGVFVSMQLKLPQCISTNLVTSSINNQNQR